MQTIKDLGSYTFPALLKNSISKFSDRIALSLVDGEPITYKQLGETADKFARLFEKLNIPRNAKIAIYSTSSPNWGGSFLGIVNYGRIAVPLLPDFNSIEVESILKHAEVSVSELRFGRMYVPRHSGVFDVREFDTIELGAVSVLHTYLAEDYEANEVAKKWQEFENRG